MCAIAGIINSERRVDASEWHELKQLLADQRHRGPDATGLIQVAERAVLGSNRLAITDPSNRAATMPFTTVCGTVTVVFNGEIYNHR